MINLPERTDRRDALTLSAALSGLKLDWVNGVKDDAVSHKAMPPGDAASAMTAGNLGSWRAHMNALNTWVPFITRYFATHLLTHLELLSRISVRPSSWKTMSTGILVLKRR